MYARRTQRPVAGNSCETQRPVAVCFRRRRQPRRYVSHGIHGPVAVCFRWRQEPSRHLSCGREPRGCSPAGHRAPPLCTPPWQKATLPHRGHSPVAVFRRWRKETPSHVSLREKPVAPGPFEVLIV